MSSNPVEKANDLLVSNRQKHNGMSWSASGSNSLATLTNVRRNHEHMQWLLHHDIRFSTVSLLSVGIERDKQDSQKLFNGPNVIGKASSHSWRPLLPACLF